MGSRPSSKEEHQIGSALVVPGGLNVDRVRACFDRAAVRAEDVSQVGVGFYVVSSDPHVR